MFKKIATIILTLVMLFSFGFSVSADDIEVYVYNDAQILTIEDAYNLNVKATEIAENYQCAVYIMALEDYYMFGDTPELCAEYLYEYLDLGYGDGKDGIMLMLSMAERDAWLLGYGDWANYTMTDYGRDVIFDEILDNFTEDDWYGGFSDYLDTCEYFLQQAEAGTPVDVPVAPPLTMGQKAVRAYGIAAFISAIGSLIIVSGYKKVMKTAVMADEADNYITPAGLKLSRKYDRYTHTTRTESKIPKETSSSSSSRGGTTVDSKGFSGSGRKF